MKAEYAKKRKYARLLPSYLFTPVAIDTFGNQGEETKRFLTTIGKRLTLKKENPREATYFMQRLSLAIQRGNAAALLAYVN